MSDNIFALFLPIAYTNEFCPRNFQTPNICNHYFIALKRWIPIPVSFIKYWLMLYVLSKLLKGCHFWHARAKHENTCFRSLAPGLMNLWIVFVSICYVSARASWWQLRARDISSTDNVIYNRTAFHPSTTWNNSYPTALFIRGIIRDRTWNWLRLF